VILTCTVADQATTRDSDIHLLQLLVLNRQKAHSRSAIPLVMICSNPNPLVIFVSASHTDNFALIAWRKLLEISKALTQEPI
jgi:hypothetical protein